MARRIASLARTPDLAARAPDLAARAPAAEAAAAAAATSADERWRVPVAAVAAPAPRGPSPLTAAAAAVGGAPPPVYFVGDLKQVPRPTPNPTLTPKP